MSKAVRQERHSLALPFGDWPLLKALAERLGAVDGDGNADLRLLLHLLAHGDFLVGKLPGESKAPPLPPETLEPPVGDPAYQQAVRFQENVLLRRTGRQRVVGQGEQ